MVVLESESMSPIPSPSPSTSKKQPLDDTKDLHILAGHEASH